jgi:hypothetical protein
MTSIQQSSAAKPGESYRTVPGYLGPEPKFSYLRRWLPSYFWQRVFRHQPRGKTHLIIALADHFEPAIVPGDGAARAPYAEQEHRLQRWCEEYPKRFGDDRDAEGRPFVHTYFYPAEQYSKPILAQLADHCQAGWGEIEIHLHHGVEAADTAENTRQQLIEFRDRLAQEHKCLCYRGQSLQPCYGFVHGNFALANSNQGSGCGVDNEMQILAETGCYADFTLPAGTFHRAQTAKINSIYECSRPLVERAPHRKGRDLARGRPPQILPLIVQGPLMLEFGGRNTSRRLHIDNAALTGSNPPTLHRLNLWKRARISVAGRPDWLFIKLHTHGMDPRHDNANLGLEMQRFVRELVAGADQRNEILHFVSAREMVNIILAACDGKEGNPGDYRDYQFKRKRPQASGPRQQEKLATALKG